MGRESDVWREGYKSTYEKEEEGKQKQKALESVVKLGR